MSLLCLNSGSKGRRGGRGKEEKEEGGGEREGRGRWCRESGFIIIWALYLTSLEVSAILQCEQFNFECVFIQRCPLFRGCSVYCTIGFFL